MKIGLLAILRGEILGSGSRGDGGRVLYCVANLTHGRRSDAGVGRLCNCLSRTTAVLRGVGWGFAVTA